MSDDLILSEFLAKYAKPFDADGDSYDKPPFASDVRSPGRSEFYNFHYYLTKVPPESIVGMILHYTAPGDLILDPFCGSGMTGIGCQMCVNPDTATLDSIPNGTPGPRAVILKDLSPAACHIAVNYTHPAQRGAVQEAFERITQDLKLRFDWLYATYHYEPAVNVYHPSNPAVAVNLKNGSAAGKAQDSMFGNHSECTWELISHEQLESALGFPAEKLPQPRDAEKSGYPPADGWIRIPATIVYVVWSDVYLCQGFKTVEEPTGRHNSRTGKPILQKRKVMRGCKREIIARWADDKQADDANNAFIRCPHCSERWLKGRLERIRVEPLEVCYEYEGLRIVNGLPQRRTIRASRPISSDDKRLISEIESSHIPYWFPNFELNKRGPRYRRDSLAGKRIESYPDFFTRRNLWAFAALWAGIEKESPPVRPALQFCFTSQIMRGSRLRRMRGDKPGEQLSGTLHVGSATVESNVLRIISRAVAQYEATLASDGSKVGEDVIVQTGSATELRPIPDETIDYIFTDPPFGANIYYSEINFLWEAWLGAFTNEPLEAVMHRPVDGGYKRLPEYETLMRSAFREIFRVLKAGRYATVEFNNSDGKVFEVIKNGLADSGFEIENMLIFDKVNRTFAQVRSEDGISEVVDKDVLFNVRKPPSKQTIGAPQYHDIEFQVVETVREHLRTLPERIKSDPTRYSDEHRTTATINSTLMNALIPKGVSVERLNLPFIERVCGRYFRKVGQRWYLRGEAVGNSVDGQNLIEEEVAIEDEISAIEWTRQRLKAGPVQLGELKPLWMRATGLLPAEVSQQLNLEDLLAENFWKDRNTNKWREPTEEERERMNDDRSLRVLHDAERFVAGSLRRSTTDEERCEWVDVLFNACKAVEENDLGAMPVLRGFDEQKGYLLISRLFRSVLNDAVDPEHYRKAEKQARVASQRLNRTLENEKEKVKANQRKDLGPTLFEGIDDE